jgi:hypothetical protein
MNIIDPFVPVQKGDSAGNFSTIIVTPAPTNASAVVTLPLGGSNLELENTGSVTVFVEFGVNTATAQVPTATPGSYGIQPGESKLIRRPFFGGVGAQVVATITAAATGALQIAAGDGS